MRTLGYFALVLSVLYMLACSKDEGKGGETKAKTNDSGAVGTQCKPVMFNGLSEDVVQGRITNRTFQVIRAYGTETIDVDSCRPEKEGDTFRYSMFGLPSQGQQQQNQNFPQPGQQQQGQFPQYGQNPQYQYNQYQYQYAQYNQQYNQMQQYVMRNRNQKPMTIKYNFDCNGILTVEFNTQAGTQVTTQPIYPVSSASGSVGPFNYTLVEPDQLIIGQFSTSGTPSADYVRNVLQNRLKIRGAGFQNYNGDVNYNQGFSPNGSSSNGFRNDFQAGQNPQAPAPVVSTPTIQMNNNVSAIATDFDVTVAKVVVSEGINNQHIHQLEVSEINKKISIQVADQTKTNRSCYTQTHATTQRVLIQ